MTQYAILFVLLLMTAGYAVSESESESGPHITDVNILLPPKMTNPVEYRLQGSDGCFKWSWDHHDIISVVPEYVSSLCSTSARVRSVAHYNSRRETAVYATDIHTGRVIRCKVFIDKISRIQIFHSSIKLDLDGLATLRVRAFDSEENEFSSLVGLQFTWKLRPEADGLSHNLVHVPLKESPLTDCGGLCGYLDIQIMLEDSGVFSDLFVVKGTGIGHEKVSVHLLEPELDYMAGEIVLTVAEAMSVDPPSPVFVLIGSALRYSLKVMRENTLQVVPLPSVHHRWSVLDSSVARVDSSTALVHALSLGITNVVVEDTRVAGHIQASSLHVVLPDTLSLYILPFSTSGDPVDESEAIPSVARWYLVCGNQYLMQMKVFSQGPEPEEIYLTERDDIKLYDDQSKYWTTSLVPEHAASFHARRNSKILKATSPGLGKLTAAFTYFSEHQESREVLKVVQEVMVCDQVKFSWNKTGAASTINLPWGPGIYQETELKVIGGCAKLSSDYKWLSSDMTTVSVSAYGIVQAKKPGKATVKALSSFDSYNYDEVVIEVSIPSSMIMLQNFPVETVIGSHIQAAVTMKAPNGAYYCRCDAFSSVIRWKAGSESFVVSNATGDMLVLDNQSPICSWTDIYASGSGRTMLYATLSIEDQVLQATSHIAAHPPLSLQRASDGSRLDKIYLAPGTELDVELLGGPERWDTETVDTVSEDNALKNGVHVHHSVGSGESLYTIACLTLGDYKLVFRRGNSVGYDHPLPVIMTVSLLVKCAIPSSIVLVVDESVTNLDYIRSAIQAERTPGRIRVSPVTVANGRTIPIAAVGISKSGEAFANSSSLTLRWELSSCDDLVYWEVDEESESSWDRFLVLQNNSGLCIVRTTVIGFGLHERSEDLLTDAVRLQLLSTLRVDPEFNLLFFNPDAKVNLSIAGGSCFWETAVNDSRVAEVIPSPPGLQCTQLMVSPKGIGTSLVRVHDIGVSPPLAAYTVVQVADVGWIKITSGEVISLVDGSLQSVDLLAGIGDGSLFDSSQYAYMNIHVFIEDSIVELVNTEAPLTPGGGYVRSPTFEIVARHLGVTTLHVTARQQSGHEIFSQAVKVEVYAQPGLHPHEMFLAPGASYVLSVKGGPTIGASIEYTSMDDGIASIQKSSGRLYAISPGNTTLLATIYGKGGTAICHAYGSINVGIPSSAILIAQSSMLAVGRDMPIYPLFPEGDLLSFCEICNNYKWIIGDEKVLGFSASEFLHSESPGSMLAVSRQEALTDDTYDNALNFMTLVSGRSAGKTNITVSFSCDFISSGSHQETRSYYASLSVSVVPDLPLSLGVPLTWVLPPYYTSSSVLPLSHDVIYSLLRSCDEKSEFMQDPISVDRDTIKTTAINNIACIQAKDPTSGRIEIASCVRVAEVAQLRITCMEFPLHAKNLAVGSELKFPIRYYDALGNPFHEAHNAVRLNSETNHRDVISINITHDGEASIHLKGLRHGKALVRVSFSQQKADYILISVGAYIHPQVPVVRIGVCLNFSVEGFDDLSSGRWVSANPSVLSIDMPSGRAEAIGEGSTEVFFQNHELNLQTTVKVLSGNLISVDSPKEMLTNVPLPAKGYSFSVKFSDEKIKGLVNGKRVAYDCRVHPPYVGYTESWEDFATHESYCIFYPYSPEHLVRSAPNIKPYISVSISASLKEAKHVSGSASALFVGGFSVTELAKDIKQLSLTPEFNKTIITVLGNTDVEIHTQNMDSLSISSILKEDFGIGGRARYEVKVLKAMRFEDKIVITLPATGQRMEVDINYDPGVNATSKKILDETFWIKALLYVILMMVPWGIWMIILRKRERAANSSQQKICTTTPVFLSDQGTPERRSPAAVYSEESPRTPQSFIDYVRSTIDETPNYRREGRRRYNNTL